MQGYEEGYSAEGKQQSRANQDCSICKIVKDPLLAARNTNEQLI